MTTSLTIFTKAALMLAEADTIQKAKELKSLALTAADWAKRKGMGEDAIQHCRSYALEAERKMGEMLAQTERPQGRRTDLVTARNQVEKPTLKEIGLTKRESADAQDLAALPKEDFDELRTGGKSRVQIKRERKEQKRESIRASNRVKISTAPAIEKVESLFSTILIDPPWDWGDEGDQDTKRAVEDWFSHNYHGGL